MRLKHSLILIAFGILGCWSALVSFGNAIYQSTPRVAVGLPGHNGFADGRLARLLLRDFIVVNGTSFSGVIPPAAKQHAIEAFKSEPSDQYAVSVLGLSSTSDLRRARNIFEASLRQNRRQTISSAWLAEDAARRNDLARSLTYFDLVLRRQKDADSTVLKRLVTSISDPKSIPLFVRLLKDSASWHLLFWQTASEADANLLNLAIIRASLMQFDYRQPVQYDSLLLSRLVSIGAYSQAWSLNRKLAGDTFVDRKSNHVSLGFNKERQLQPFFWIISGDRGDVGAQIDEKKSILDISSVSRSSAVVARRLLRLDNLIFRLGVEVDADLASQSGAQMGVELACAEEKRMPVALSFPIGRLRKQGAKVDLRASECHFFWLVISIDNDTDDGLDFSILDVTLDKA